MKRSYLSITDEYKIGVLASAVAARELEVFHYQLNVDNYTDMLADLPKDPTPTGVDEATAAAYALRDELLQRIQAESREQSKAQRVLDVLIARLPSDATQRAALFVAAPADKKSVV